MRSSGRHLRHRREPAATGIANARRPRPSRHADPAIASPPRTASAGRRSVSRGPGVQVQALVPAAAIEDALLGIAAQVRLRHDRLASSVRPPSRMPISSEQAPPAAPILLASGTGSSALPRETPRPASVPLRAVPPGTRSSSSSTKSSKPAPQESATPPQPRDAAADDRHRRALPGSADGGGVASPTAQPMAAADPRHAMRRRAAAACRRAPARPPARPRRRPALAPRTDLAGCATCPIYSHRFHSAS